MPLVVDSQNLRINTAKQLEQKLQFSNALKIWNDLSSDHNNARALSQEDWRSAFTCAYYSEQYRTAVNFSTHLSFKQIHQNGLSELYLSSIIRTGLQDSISPYFLDSLAHYKGDLKWKMIQEERFQFAKSRPSSSRLYEVSLLRESVNHEEFGLFPLSNGEFYFISDQYDDFITHRKDGRSGNNYYSIVKATSKDLSDAKRWTEIPFNHFHVGPVSLTPSGSKIFVTVNDDEKNKGEKLKVHTLDLLAFYKTESGWKSIELPFNSSSYSTGHGVIDTLGNLIFTSDMPGGYGGADLYMAKYSNGNWIDPVNLGPSINTPGNELFPFISAKGILYFSSDGWQGLGGLDVYSWNNGDLTPNNLMAPINSNSDDFSIWLDEDTGSGYFSSNRINSKDQLYQFKFEPFHVKFRIHAQLCDNVPVVNDSIFIKDLNNGFIHPLVTNSMGYCFFNGAENGAYEFSMIAKSNVSGASRSFFVSEPGEFNIELQPLLDDQVVHFKVVNNKGMPIQGAMVEVFRKVSKKNKKKFLTDKKGQLMLSRSDISGVDSIKVSFFNHSDFTWRDISEKFCVDTVKIDVVLIKNQERDLINLDLILYDYDKFNLRQISKVELDKLVGYMKKHPGMKVELSSHTDSRGTAEYNERLSQNRSNSCVNYIISKGISSELIIAKGYGEYRLKNRCADGVDCSEEEHQQNRRTELHILLNEVED